MVQPARLITLGAQQRRQAEDRVTVVVDHQHAQRPRRRIRAQVRLGDGEILGQRPAESCMRPVSAIAMLRPRSIAPWISRGSAGLTK